MVGLVHNFIKRCNAALGMVSGLGVLAMGLILAYEVVTRYFFNAPTIWAQETATYLYMWTMLAAASYTLQEGKHVHVDLLTERLPFRAKMLAEIGTSAIALCFCAIVTLQAYQMIAATVQFGKVSATPLRVPLWIPQSALFIGFLLLTFQFGLIFIDRVTELKARRNQEGTLA
jgi:TRAP-type C4-dicarboxylate transport system permease small subunit